MKFSAYSKKDDDEDDRAPDSKPSPGEMGSESSERDALRIAFAAMGDGDRDGFVEGMLTAIRICARKIKLGSYEDTKEDRSTNSR